MSQEFVQGEETADGSYEVETQLSLLEQGDALLKAIRAAAETGDLKFVVEWRETEHVYNARYTKGMDVHYACAVYEITDASGNPIQILNRQSYDGVSSQEWAQGKHRTFTERIPAAGSDWTSWFVPSYNDWYRERNAFDREVSVHADALYGDHNQQTATQYFPGGHVRSEELQGNLADLVDLTSLYLVESSPTTD